MLRKLFYSSGNVDQNNQIIIIVPFRPQWKPILISALELFALRLINRNAIFHIPAPATPSAPACSHYTMKINERTTYRRPLESRIYYRPPTNYKQRCATAIFLITLRAPQQQIESICRRNRGTVSILLATIFLSPEDVLGPLVLRGTGTCTSLLSHSLPRPITAAVH